MKSRKTSWIALIVVIAMVIACTLVAVFGFGSKHQGKASNIKLGLDLAGGVNITYQADEENPSDEDMNDTVYKLQQRVTAYSTEAEVYRQGTNRINVDIPGVYNAEEILEELGNPGTISFCETTKHGDEEEVLDGYYQILDGSNITSAEATTQQDEYGNSEYVVSLMFDSEGTELFSEATERNVGSPIYIIYDGEVISSPTVNSQISNGQCVIEGNFDYESANALATTIRAGKLNLNLTEISSKVVSAKLGSEAVSTSLKAAIIGMILVMIFMIAFYWVAGVAASIALALYCSAMLCFLNGLDITLTLPGIAGIILNIGMAVDANVIIFTRIREEIAAGKTVREAFGTGFHKALSAVLDGNITTLIAAAILYAKGTGTIRGFAITLTLGIVLSMFTALLITRITLYALYGIGFRDEKFYGRQKPPKIRDYYGFKKIAYPISIALICLGFISMGVHHANGSRALNFSLDFTGGTAMTVQFNEAMDIPGSDEQALMKIFQENAGTSDVQFQVTTDSDSNEVVIKCPVLTSEQRQAVKTALEEQYDLSEDKITEENISGVVSSEMRQNALVSIIIAGICMLIYIWIRFRDLRFGASAILALLHDVLIVLMVYAVFRISVGTTFIACMLTIVGYSINATIVIFDRIRENLKIMRGKSYPEIVNISISQTMSRSINTSLTTFITVFCLFIMGVPSIREFTLPIMAGIIGGAWSSITITGTLWCIMKGGYGKGGKPVKGATAAAAPEAGIEAKPADTEKSTDDVSQPDTEDSSGTASSESSDSGAQAPKTKKAGGNPNKVRYKRKRNKGTMH